MLNASSRCTSDTCLNPLNTWEANFTESALSKIVVETRLTQDMCGSTALNCLNSNVEPDERPHFFLYLTTRTRFSSVLPVPDGS